MENNAIVSFLSTSLILEHRLPFLHKRSHAFRPILQRKRAIVQSALVLQSGTEVCLFSYSASALTFLQPHSQKGSHSPSKIAALASCTTGMLRLAILCAAAIVLSNSSSIGHVCDTRPRRRSSLPEIVEDVRIMSMAFCLPTAWQRRWVPPAPGMVL